MYTQFEGDNLEINKIYNENCMKTMARMPDNFIDLTVTSPPYDNLRTYKGYDFDFESIANELYRVTKDGGVVVWVVGDATIKGSETGTSFKQALYFKECGFNLHDTMIYQKVRFSPYDPKNMRYKQQFEYMFVFSKGKPKTYKPIKDIPNKHKGLKYKGRHGRNIKDKIRKANLEFKVLGEFQDRSNIWKIVQEVKQSNHSAPFSEKLANDHIISWSNENDLVYDPMAGSGTVAKMAIRNKRNWIVSEISSEYCEIIKERLMVYNSYTHAK